MNFFRALVLLVGLTLLPSLRAAVPAAVPQRTTLEVLEGFAQARGMVLA